MHAGSNDPFVVFAAGHVIVGNLLAELKLDSALVDHCPEISKAEKDKGSQNQIEIESETRKKPQAGGHHARGLHESNQSSNNWNQNNTYVSWNSSFPGIRFAMLNWPPISLA